MIFEPPQHGKFLPATTPIFTPTGWKAHGELKSGDYVYGQDGLPKKVIASTELYMWPVVDVVFQNGQKISCAKEHLWKILVDKDDKKPRHEIICETKDIYNQKNRRSPAIKVSPPFENKQCELPIDPYLLGLWLGDGNSANDGFTTSDAELLKEFELKGYKISVRCGKYHYGILGGFKKQLNSIGVIKNKHIPIKYLLSSKDQRMSLLQGLMDIDGCVDTRGNCEFCQMSGNLANDVYTLVRTLGIKARRAKYRAFLNGKDVGEKTRILFNPDKTEKIFRLARKQKRLSEKTAKDRSDKYFFFFKSISQNQRLEAGNCIQVDGGMYLAGEDMIPTHNSELVSRRLPSFLLGRNPRLQVAGCSYSADLAGKFNREIQRIISDPLYAELFPETRLNSSNVVSSSKGAWLRNSDIFEIVNHGGSYRGVGIGGPLTGNKVDIGIIDDPIKDRLEAQSETYRNRIWEWYLDVFCTRLHNDSQVLLTMTRWHEDDLAGRILSKEDKKWTVLSLPAIKEDNNNPEDIRQVGDVLWEKRHSKEKILSLKVASERTFISMYQQRPAPAEGGMFKAKWFKYYHSMPTMFDRIIQSWDCTFTGGKESDFVVGTIWGKRGADSFLIGLCRGQWDFVETIKQMKIVNDAYPYCQEKLIEEKANGAAIISMLKQQIHGLIPVCPKESKESRAYAITFAFESGNVYFPANSPWVQEIENELKMFPNGKHDDIVDSISQALNRLYLRSSGRLLHMG